MPQKPVIEKKVFAFTGIPGSGVQKALLRMKAYLSSPTLSVEYYCLDNVLWACFVKAAQTNPALLEATDLTPLDLLDKEPNWWKLLKLPVELIKKFWIEAAVEIQDQIQALNRTRSTYVLISFHAEYHSDDYHWRFCAVDIETLRKFQFSAFFTLVDDIYDIWRRRWKDRRWVKQKMESREGHDPLIQLLSRTTQYLRQFIAWRQAEVVLTDFFAATLSGTAAPIPSHIVSVKHPRKTLARLLKDPELAVYLSHPISAMRRLPTFPQSTALTEMREVFSALRSQVTLIEPTTIDELRIAKTPAGDEGEAKKRYYLPKLTPRWPLLARPDELIGEIIELDEALIPEHFLRGLSGIENEWKALTNGTGSPILQEVVSEALLYLSERISDDISWRDHHLVDQTRRLAVYRPTFEGHTSRGVARECLYLGKLSKTTHTPFRALVLCPTKDRERFPAQSASTLYESAEEFFQFALDAKKRVIEKFSRCLLPTLETQQQLDEIVAQLISVLEDFVANEGAEFEGLEESSRERRSLSPGSATVFAASWDTHKSFVRAAFRASLKEIYHPDWLALEFPSYQRVIREKDDFVDPTILGFLTDPAIA